MIDGENVDPAARQIGNFEVIRGGAQIDFVFFAILHVAYVVKGAGFHVLKRQMDMGKEPCPGGDCITNQARMRANRMA